MQEFFRTLLENIIHYVRDATVSDYIDILLVTLIVYQLIKLLRRTKAIRVIQGVVLLAVLMLLAELLQLQTINYILSNTMQVGIIAIIVMFQPELRKMLEQIGSKSTLQQLLAKESRSTVEAAIMHTVEACKTFAWERTGALIIFQRNVILTDILRTGTMINAETSSELLQSIFFPKSPLHDGAVIIEEGRVVGAGCMLPLTTSTTVNRELGMRHRAALGMSETSDAVCIVVSEETGSISLVQDGIIKRHLTPDTLEKMLNNELLVDEEIANAKGLKRFTRRWRRKS
ncbi:MAG: diadenylate cyclase CdaA [Oscillospiraceae bacterium]|nr:diadenylate cyclase CdaA [Oscillospiraceae bacterium]